MNRSVYLESCLENMNKRSLQRLNLNDLSKINRKTPDKVDNYLDKAIENAISFDGQPPTEHDKKVMKQLIKEYLAGKK